MKFKIYVTSSLLCSTILLLSGMVGIISGILGDSWWLSGNRHIGLWQNRSNLLQVKGDNKEYDVILLILIFSVSASMLALTSSSYLLQRRCRQKNVSHIAFILMSVFTLITAVASVSGMVYSEYQYECKWSKIYTHGWSVILAWIGCIHIVMSFLMSLVTTLLSSKQKIQDQ